MQNFCELFKDKQDIFSVLLFCYVTKRGSDSKMNSSLI